MLYVVLIFSSILVFLFSLSYYLVKITTIPTIMPYETTYLHEVEEGWFTLEYFEDLPKKEIYIDSPQGYKIHGFWIPMLESKKCIVIVHGFSYSLFGSIKYLKIFRELGFNILIYDQRYHGLSGGKNSTFGFKEKEDLKSIFDYITSLLGDQVIIGTHGESLGGATVLMHASEDERVKFVISDCAYSSVLDEFKHRLKEDYHLPPFPIIPLASLINKIKIGAFYRELSPLKASQKIKVPTFIIHGSQDTYTPFEQGRQLFEALNCPKKWYAPHAKHASALKVNPSEYRDQIIQFLIENHLN